MIARCSCLNVANSFVRSSISSLAALYRFRSFFAISLCFCSSSSLSSYGATFSYSSTKSIYSSYCSCCCSSSYFCTLCFSISIFFSRLILKDCLCMRYSSADSFICASYFSPPTILSSIYFMMSWRAACCLF